ncbi:hypothetical protein LNO20_13415 [Klebsiella quasipneumoniae subsp. quasipneumoniae]|nr:hypothetical protein [Klebsiella quasipneumoniae subsp. quasipneumoniae]
MKKNIAFFDFDGTITHEDTFTPFIYQSLDAKAIRRGKLRLLPYILAWKMGWLSASAIRQKVFHYAFAGKSQPEILQRGNDHSLAFIPPHAAGERDAAYSLASGARGHRGGGLSLAECLPSTVVPAA